jgi:hypothetical protein
MVITRVAPLSVAKIAGIIYAALGLVMGVVFMMIGTLGAFARAGADDAALPRLFPMMFGAGAMIFAPIFYGCLGFVGSLIASVLYNAAAGVMGGVRVDVE